MNILYHIRGDGLKAQLLRGGGSSIVIKMIQLVLSFFLSVMLARSLGPDGYGIYAFTFALLSFLAIPVQAGLPQLVVRVTARACVTEDWPLMRGVWQWSARFVLLFSVVLIVGFCGTLLLGQELIDLTHHATLVAGLLLIPLIAMSNLIAAALRGLQHVVLGQLPGSIIRPILLIVFILLALWLIPIDRLASHNAMILHVVATGFALAIGAWCLCRYKPKGVVKESQLRTEPAEWRRAALPLSLVSGLEVFNSYADILLLGMMSTDTEVGVYRAVVQMGGLVVFGLNAVTLVLHPYFAKLYAQGDLRTLQRVVTISARVILSFALPPVLLFLFAGGHLLGLIFGSEYEGGAIALSFLAIGQLFNAGCGSVGALLNMTGHETDTMRGMVTAAVMNVILNLVLIPLYGMAGAAAASAASLAVWNLVLWKYVWERLKIESSAFLPRRHYSPV